MTTRAIRDRDLFQEVGAILGRDIIIPDKKGYRGTGAPGRILEDQLHIAENNQDLPDAGRWELKFTSRTSPLTLFHKDPCPRDPSISLELVSKCGYQRKDGTMAFCHTIWGNSPRGFTVKVDAEKVSVVNKKHPNVVPYWDIDDLNNSAVTKLRNLLLVFGHKKTKGAKRIVRFNIAHMCSGFKFSEFLNGLKEGWIAIDFDAHMNNNRKTLRNHGVKFRVKPDDLALLYKNYKRLYPETSAQNRGIKDAF